jgi:hypothetical protein
LFLGLWLRSNVAFFHINERPMVGFLSLSWIILMLPQCNRDADRTKDSLSYKSPWKVTPGKWFSDLLDMCLFSSGRSLEPMVAQFFSVSQHYISLIFILPYENMWTFI